MLREMDWLRRRSIWRTGKETRIPCGPYEWHATRPQSVPKAMIDCRCGTGRETNAVTRDGRDKHGTASEPGFTD